MSITIKNFVIFVTDLVKAKSFYVDLLGLPVAGQSEMLIEFSWGRHYAGCFACAA